MVNLSKSVGGRPIQAMLISNSETFIEYSVLEQSKLTVMLVGSQHGDESSDAETILLLARKLVAGEHSDLLGRLNLVLVALANPDGRDLSSRYNASKTNINYLALRARETRLLVDALHTYQPDVVYDAHESPIWKHMLTKQQVF